MNNQGQAAPIKPTTLALGSFGLAIVLSVFFAIIARLFGMLFSGLDTPFTVGGAILFTLIATAITNAIFKRAIARFGWRFVWAKISVYALISVMGLSWAQTREHLAILMKPMPVPGSVNVRHGRRDLFRFFVHFTASQSDIETLIRSKQLIEVPDWDPSGEAGMPEGFSERDNTKTAWSWWQPASMPKARFYYRFHKTDFSGWTEGWWISGETNEVFAYISGS